MKQMKTREEKNTTVKNIKVTTQVKVTDMEPVKATGPCAPASDEEVSETTILVNPDPNSMESRG